MKKLRDYIKNLGFQYAISYSGLRGKEFEDFEKLKMAEIQQIKQKIKHARFMQVSKLRKTISTLENEVNIFNSRIVTIDGQFHATSKLIHKFEKRDKRMTTIIGILNSKFDKKVVAMCPPVFRDAIVFYTKENKISGILQICFGCLWMKNEKEEDLEADYKVFDLLKNELLQLGHQIKE